MTIPTTPPAPAIDWPSLKESLGRLVLEVAESAVLGCMVPNPISGCYEDELPRVRRAILRTRSGNLARFRDQVNRNAFLLGCLDYTQSRQEEHLLIGYGFRYGRTTKVESLHHIIGGTGSVCLPAGMAHAMWDYYQQQKNNELLIFHNHPFNPLNFLIDNLPLPSRTDRRLVEEWAINPRQLVRQLLGRGRIHFYLGENGFVKEYRLPSIIALAQRSGGSAVNNSS